MLQYAKLPVNLPFKRGLQRGEKTPVAPPAKDVMLYKPHVIGSHWYLPCFLRPAVVAPRVSGRASLRTRIAFLSPRPVIRSEIDPVLPAVL